MWLMVNVYNFVFLLRWKSTNKYYLIVVNPKNTWEALKILYFCRKNIYVQDVSYLFDKCNNFFFDFFQEEIISVTF